MVTESLKFRNIYLSVIIFLISDMLLLFFPELKAWHISWLIKAPVVLYYSYVFFKESSKFQKIALSVLSGFFFISQSIFYFLEKTDKNYFMENMRFFMWYIFLLIMFSLFFKTLKNNANPKHLKHQNKLAFIIIAFICIFILIGFIFEVEVFKTYGQVRWGYRGVIRKSATLSYIFIILLFFSYYKFIIKTNKPLYWFVILFCALLSGTKTIYAFIALLFCYHVFYRKLYLKKAFYLSLITLSALLIVFNGFFLAKTKFIWGIFYELYLEKGFLYSLSSIRSEIFVDASKTYFDEWHIHNYLIGGRLDDSSFEMALFDLFSFFGLIGTLLYLYYLKRVFLDRFINTSGSKGRFIIGSFALAAFFTGQFFTNSTVILFVWFFLLIFKLNFDAKSAIK